MCKTTQEGMKMCINITKRCLKSHESVTMRREMVVQCPFFS